MWHFFWKRGLLVKFPEKSENWIKIDWNSHLVTEKWVSEILVRICLDPWNFVGYGFRFFLFFIFLVYTKKISQLSQAGFCLWEEIFPFASSDGSIHGLLQSNHGFGCIATGHHHIWSNVGFLDRWSRILGPFISEMSASPLNQQTLTRKRGILT